MTSKQVSCVRLTHIFRQAQNSLIVMNAHKINRGEFPVSFLPDARKDFKFIKEERYESVEDHIKQIFVRDIASQGISADNTMVLTPMNRGPIGTIALNNFLQKLLNPQERVEIAHAGTIFKQGDKVMQIRNNYDKQVFNGDIGLVEQIDHEQRQMVVNFNEHQRVVYEFDELNELVLSYAISIHKSQGSEYDAVIIPIFVQHFMLLQRNLIYTALTRAKKMAIFIGQPRALAIALRTTKGTARLTFLSQFLGEQ
jgi:exodeoxyribonuclease V alpha subunit